MKFERQLNIELIRIFSMFLICFWHVNGHFFPLLPKDIIHVGDLFAKIIPYITFHVDLFVLITGYFGINNYKKKIFKTCSLILFYVIILTIITSCAGIGDIKWTQLLPFSGAPWWFLHIYLVLLLISPIINNYLKDKKRNIYSLLFITTFINVYLGWFRHIPLYDNHGYDIFNFINLYVIGYWLHTEGKIISKFKQKTIVLLLSFIICCVIRYKVQPIIYFNWWDYSSPLNIFMAVCVFCLFLKLRVSQLFYKPIMFLSTSAIAVYLITDYSGIYTLIASILYEFIKYGENAKMQFLIIIFFVIVMFIFCCFIDKMRIIIIKPIEDYCYQKFGDYVKRFRRYHSKN